MKVKIITYGCSLNQADSEIIAAILKDKGCELSESKPDIAVVNTCTVKTPTDRKIKKLLNQLKSQKVFVIVAGCLPAAQPEVVEEYPEFSFIGVNSCDIGKALDKIKKNETYVNIQQSRDKLNRPRVKTNNVVGIIPISQGCLGSCNYCITKKARGNLKSEKIKDIKKEVGRFLKEDCKEIWLTSPDTGAWGKDKAQHLPELLNAICEIKGDYKIRVGMMNVEHAKDNLKELIESYKNEKIYKFAHIPVQTGCDKVLEEMNRKYTTNDFKHVVKKLRELNITIATDIICGYPTETEKDYTQTLKLLKETKPDVLNVSRYWERPGTPSAELKAHPTWITKERSKKAGLLFQDYGKKQNDKWIGWNGECLISSTGKDDTMTARNDYYKPIIIKCPKEKLGEKIMIEVTDATYYDLRGKII